jgi:ribosome-associated translation inhibitor RaiA
MPCAMNSDLAVRGKAITPRIAGAAVKPLPRPARGRSTRTPSRTSVSHTSSHLLELLAMSFPLTITFRDLSSSPTIEEFVRRWASKLEAIYDRIERCQVVIERPHQRHHQGQRYHIRVTLAVPGPDIEVSRDHALDGAHEDVYVAIRDAFRAARRQLEDHARRQRADVKTHLEPEHGRVTYLDVEGEWGYLEAGGRQIYFHRNSVLDDAKLAVGDEVRFTEERGDKGPQATSVARIGKHGHHELSNE